MSPIQPVTFYVPSSAAEPVELGVAHSGLRMALVTRESVRLLAARVSRRRLGGSISGLVAAGLLTAGQRLHARQRGADVEATVLATGGDPGRRDIVRVAIGRGEGRDGARLGGGLGSLARR